MDLLERNDVTQVFEVHASPGLRELELDHRRRFRETHHPAGDRARGREPAALRPSCGASPAARAARREGAGRGEGSGRRLCAARRAVRERVVPEIPAVLQVRENGRVPALPARSASRPRRRGQARRQPPARRRGRRLPAPQARRRLLGVRGPALRVPELTSATTRRSRTEPRREIDVLAKHLRSVSESLGERELVPLTTWIQRSFSNCDGRRVRRPR